MKSSKKKKHKKIKNKIKMKNWFESANFSCDPQNSAFILDIDLVSSSFPPLKNNNKYYKQSENKNPF